MTKRSELSKHCLLSCLLARHGCQSAVAKLVLPRNRRFSARLSFLMLSGERCSQGLQRHRTYDEHASSWQAGCYEGVLTTALKRLP
ncbi:hypothetical protein D3C86_1638610 [compost metagenome]